MRVHTYIVVLLNAMANFINFCFSEKRAFLMDG